VGMRWPPREDGGGGRRTRGGRAGIGGGEWWPALLVWAGGGAMMGIELAEVEWARWTFRSRRAGGALDVSSTNKIEEPSGFHRSNLVEYVNRPARHLYQNMARNPKLTLIS
jgi:hypothetical protein